MTGPFINVPTFEDEHPIYRAGNSIRCPSEVTTSIALSRDLKRRGCTFSTFQHAFLDAFDPVRR